MSPLRPRPANPSRPPRRMFLAGRGGGRRKVSLNMAQRLVSKIPIGVKGITVALLSEQWIKIVQASGPVGHRTLTFCAAGRIAGMPDEEVLAVLRKLCSQKGFFPAEVLIANPSQATTMRLFALPSTHPNEIRDIVELQVEKHTPYAREDILTDFRVIESDRSGYSKVLLFISHKDVVLRGLKFAQMERWTLQRVGFELEGLVNWAQRQNLPKDAAEMVVEIDSDLSTLVILYQGRPYFHRSIPIGAKQLTENPAENQAKLVAEFQRSLETFDMEGFSVRVSEILLTGRVQSAAGLDLRIQQGLDIPVRVVDPAENLPEKDPEQEVSFVSLIGLALWESEVDLTPQALKLHRVFEMRAKAMVGLGCQLLAALLLVSCWVMGRAQRDTQYHAKLLAIHQIQEEESSDLQNRLDELHLVSRWQDAAGTLLESLVELHRVTPPAIRWKVLTFKKGQEVILKGFSDEAPKIFDFVSSLEGSPLFSQVKARNMTKRKEQEKDVTEFEVVCSFVSQEAAGEEKENIGD